MFNISRNSEHFILSNAFFADLNIQLHHILLPVSKGLIVVWFDYRFLTINTDTMTFFYCACTTHVVVHKRYFFTICNYEANTSDLDEISLNMMFWTISWFEDNLEELFCCIQDIETSVTWVLCLKLSVETNFYSKMLYSCFMLIDLRHELVLYMLWTL